VTEILKGFTSYDKVPTQILERAAARGTTVHAICAGIAEGAWIPDSVIDPELLGYIESFKLRSEAQVKEYTIIEQRYTHSEMNYTGQLDFVIKSTDNELYLVDLKTSAKPQKTYPVQMAAYDMLLKQSQVTVKGAMIVYLNKAGEFPDIHLLEDMTEERTVFINALHCWQYFNKGKKNVRKEAA
jgi:predicted RecB family nuclease